MSLRVLQESEDAVKALAKEKDMLEREKWDLRRQTKEATEQANILRAQMDMKENRVKELEAELTMVSHHTHGQNFAQLTHTNKMGLQSCCCIRISSNTRSKMLCYSINPRPSFNALILSLG